MEVMGSTVMGSEVDGGTGSTISGISGIGSSKGGLSCSAGATSAAKVGGPGMLSGGMAAAEISVVETSLSRGLDTVASCVASSNDSPSAR